MLLSVLNFKNGIIKYVWNAKGYWAEIELFPVKLDFFFQIQFRVIWSYLNNLSL